MKPHLDLVGTTILLVWSYMCCSRILIAVSQISSS